MPDPVNRSERERRLDVIHRKPADLIPYAKNARTHSPGQVDQIVASIKEFGFTNPILVRGSDVIAGHGRLAAAQKLGFETVPTLDLSHLSEVQARAYVLADNQLALNAGWDLDLLRAELTDLEVEGVDLNLLGFEDVEKLLSVADQDAGGGAGDDSASVTDACSIVIECTSEAEQRSLLERFMEEGLTCRALI